MESVTRTTSGASTTIASSSTSTIVPAATEPISRRVSFHVSAIPANCTTFNWAEEAFTRPLARTTGSFGGFATGSQLYCANPAIGQNSARTPNSDLQTALIHGAVAFFTTARTASTANWAACPDAAGNPPTFSATVSLVIATASSTVLPETSSVINDPHAIAGTHPLARKRISRMHAAIHLDRQFQNVATRRVLHPHTCIRIGEVSGISRMFKVIDQLWRIHEPS